MHQTSPRKSSHTSSHNCKRTNPVRERTTRCRWLRRLCLTRTSRILQLIFRQSRSMSSSCRVDSNYRFGRLTFDPTAGVYASVWRGSLERNLSAFSRSARGSGHWGTTFHKLGPRISAVGRFCCRNRHTDGARRLVHFLKPSFVSRWFVGATYARFYCRLQRLRSEKRGERWWRGDQLGKPAEVLRNRCQRELERGPAWPA